MALPFHRNATLDFQRQALRDEFTAWRAQTAKGQKLEKHQSQVEKINHVLMLLIDTAFEKNIPGESSFTRSERLFRNILLAHRIWAYFRGKLALRYVPNLQPDLVVSDEFAWACYRPAREAAEKAGSVAIEHLKEPPLVFFTGEASPYAAARMDPFSPEGVTTRDIKDFGAAILSLPVPVVGVPWFQVQHLPLAVIIGHEVGHLVMDDLGLQQQVAAALEANKAKLNGHHEAWSSWLREVFADVYGVLSAGPAFALALMQYLLDEPDAIQKELPGPDGYGSYPPRTLRMHIIFEILRQIGLAGPETESLETTWKDTYPRHLMRAYQKETPALVEVLLNSPLDAFGGACLREVICFSQNDQRRAAILTGRLLLGSNLTSSTPFRPLFAAATLAYQEDLAGYQRINKSKPMARRMLSCVPAGVRAAPMPAPDRSGGEQAAVESLMRLLEP